MSRRERDARRRALRQRRQLTKAQRRSARGLDRLDHRRAARLGRTRSATAVVSAAALGLTGALTSAPALSHATSATAASAAAVAGDTPYVARLVADLAPGTEASDPGEFTEMGGEVFFAATTTDAGRELWKTDGTAAGTVLVKDTDPRLAGYSPRSGDPTDLVVMDGVLYFSSSGPLGRELWRSDGTEAGTVMVKNINESDPVDGTDASGAVTQIVEMEGSLFFVARDNAGFPANRELWTSDVTEAGTVKVKEINPGNQPSSPSHLTVTGGRLFFSAADEGLYASNRELWTSDGTEDGTRLVKDINTGSGGLASSAPSPIVAVDDLVYFGAEDDGTAGRELWRSDGKEEGTTLVRDIREGSYSGYPTDLTVVEDAVFFGAVGKDGRELWLSDGTEDGTTVVEAEGTSPQQLTAHGDVLYFAATDADGEELWVSDGTEDGTGQVADVNPGPAESEPRALTPFDGRLVFSAEDTAGRELWLTDGTTSGTTQLADINPGPGSSYPWAMTAVGDTLIFSADDGVHGTELWIAEIPGPEVPSNNFAVSKGKTDQKKATIKLKVKVPGPGVARLAPKGKSPVKTAKATAGKAKTLTLLLKPNGKGKAKLNKQLKKGKRTAKLKVKVKVSYRPVGGTMRQQIKTYTLKKKRR